MTVKIIYDEKIKLVYRKVQTIEGNMRCLYSKNEDAAEKKDEIGKRNFVKFLLYLD